MDAGAGPLANWGQRESVCSADADGDVSFVRQVQFIAVVHGVVEYHNIGYGEHAITKLFKDVDKLRCDLMNWNIDLNSMWDCCIATQDNTLCMVRIFIRETSVLLESLIHRVEDIS